MAQQIIVFIIGALTLTYIALAIFRTVTRRKDPCSGCSGCDLKRDLDRKRKTCAYSKKRDCGCK